MKEELKKLIEKAGTLKLLAVVICGVLLLFFSYSENADEKAAAPASSSDVTDAETKGTLEEYKAEREEELKQLLQRVDGDRKSTRLNSSHIEESRMPSSA